ncbi:hypothetical protein K501DRAFT_283994 [Backusella circina FSU 941]|nr:hypothetical protein K501DRAFT_283994 [Backusella circina FSU 941]
MVCLGPRKKEKKNNLLSPEDATTRGLKKPGSKLKKPTLQSSKKSSTLNRTSMDSIASKNSTATTATGRTSTTLPRPTSRNQLNNTRSPSPVNRPTSRTPTNARSPSPAGAKPTSTVNNNKSRPSSIQSVKSTTGTRPTSRPPSGVSTPARKFPISEMKEEVKDLKLKNDENLKLIADQKAELDKLKQQLEAAAAVAKEEGENVKEDEEEAIKLKEREEQLLLREREIEELKIRLEQEQQQAPPPAIVVQAEEDTSKANELAERERLLEERAAKLEAQEKLIEEKTPEIEMVASQLEDLKSQNQDAVSQLAAKEKELEELRLVIKQGEDKEQDQVALQKIEELNKQLELQKKTHEDSLRIHEEALAEKDKLLTEQKAALESLEEGHKDEVFKLKTNQAESVIALKKKHKQDKLEMEAKMEETKKAAQVNPDINDHLERILHEFEQQEHSFAVEIKDLEQSHQSELDHLQDDQEKEVKKLQRTQDLSKDNWTARYLPTDAVSWPAPRNAPKLKPTPLVESKSKTLLRVLGNMPANKKPEPVLTPLDTKKVQVYYSSVSSLQKIKRNQEHIQQLLKSKDIKFSLVDVAQSEAARQYAKKCNNNGSNTGRIKEFPQLYVGGEYRGQYEDIVDVIDGGDKEALDELLRPAKERQFTAEERAMIQKAELNEELASTPQQSLPPLPDVMPILKPTKSVSKAVKPIKDSVDDEELFKLLEEELKSGGNIDLDNL